MLYRSIHKRICKVCALATASLILPALAIADRDNDNWLKGDKNEHRWGDNDNGKWLKGDRDQHRWGEHERNKGSEHIPVVPETNAVWVLIPFLGAVLLYSWRRIARAKA